MSELVTNVEVEEKTEEIKKDELVSKKVLDQYKSDMFKYKSKMKDTESELQKLRDQIALQEKQTLEDSAEWKTLYEREKEEKTKALGELENKSKFFIDTSKRQSVIQKLGGFRKDSYASFIETSNINMNDDGTFNAESVLAEVDRIKQEFPELIKMTTLGKMPNEAAQNMGQPQNRNLGNLSSSELLDLYSKVKT